MVTSSSARAPISQGTTDLQEAIRRRAQEIYEQSGKVPGRDLENWTRAEAEILGDRTTPQRRPAIVVEVDGVRYVGEYEAESCGGYTAGEFGPGQEIPVRFAGDKMLVRRANGTELETTIVHRTT